MSDTLVDSNVLIDILSNDPTWVNWSDGQLRAARRTGRVVINQLIYAEICAGYRTQRETDRALTGMIYHRENLPWDAAFSTSQAYRAYRQGGGTKRSPLPDFYIGAHANLKRYTLLTRDPDRYRTYFPALTIVAPGTHP
jgi:predicted nucleic acid-binding protein